GAGWGAPPGQPGWPAQPYPYPYQQPAAPQAPARRNNRVVLFLVLGIVAALLVCGGLATATVFVVRGQNSGSTRASGPTPAPAASGKTHTGDLRTYLVAKPAGARDWQQPLGTDEKLSRDQEAQLSVTDSQSRLSRLNMYNFVDGAVRTWDGTNGDVVAVRLLRFDNPGDAEGFYQADASESMSAFGMTNVSPIDGVDEGLRFANPTVDSVGYIHYYSEARNGDVVALLIVGQHTSQGVPAPVDQLFKQQYDRL
ncbi:MAG TPA: hypothetical protein VJT31_33755, partial [Rugosimonospora sp.]|nr:hypothetical protein [Rugosimonospora sp.]